MPRNNGLDEVSETRAFKDAVEGNVVDGSRLGAAGEDRKKLPAEETWHLNEL